MALRLTRFAALTLIVLLANGQARAETKTIARCGAGFLEDVDGYRVLHLKGTPYEMGYQQGALLRDDIRENVHYLFDVKAKEMKVELGGVKLLDPRRVISGIAATAAQVCARAVLRRDARNRRRRRGWTFKTSSSPTSSRSCFTARGLPSAARPQRTVRSTTAGSSTTGATGGSRSTPC